MLASSLLNYLQLITDAVIYGLERTVIIDLMSDHYLNKKMIGQTDHYLAHPTCGVW